MRELVLKSAVPILEGSMAQARELYNWAQAMFGLASTDSDDLNELAAAAELDPKSGDLAEVDLSAIDLSGQDLSGWDLRNANLENANLSETELRGAIIDPWELVTAKNWEQAVLDDDLREVAQTLNPNLRRRVDEQEFSVRTSQCLGKMNIEFVGDLVQKSEPELLRIENFGRKSLNEVKELLARWELHLGMELASWPPQRLTSSERSQKYQR